MSRTTALEIEDLQETGDSQYHVNPLETQAFSAQSHLSTFHLNRDHQAPVFCEYDCVSSAPKPYNRKANLFWRRAAYQQRSQNFIVVKVGNDEPRKRSPSPPEFVFHEHGQESGEEENQDTLHSRCGSRSRVVREIGDSCTFSL